MKKTKIKSLETKPGSPEIYLDRLLFPLVSCYQFGGGAVLTLAEVRDLFNQLKQEYGIKAEFGKTLSHGPDMGETELLEYNVGLATSGADSILFSRAPQSEGFLYQIASGLRLLLEKNQEFGRRFEAELRASGMEYSLAETLVGVSDVYPEGRSVSSDF